MAKQLCQPRWPLPGTSGKGAETTGCTGEDGGRGRAREGEMKGDPKEAEREGWRGKRRAEAKQNGELADE